jgi:predicted MFS family arabinose efflux permease
MSLVSDLVPQETLGRGLAMYSATTWLGGIAGCAITGAASQSFGLAPTLLAGACLPLLTTGLLAAVGRSRKPAFESDSPSGEATPSLMPSPA